MPRVYFDTNVYDRIDKGEVPSTDVDALRHALSERTLAANLSIADVEELLGQWETNRPAAIRKLQLARDLVGFAEMLKQPSELLADAFKATLCFNSTVVRFICCKRSSRRRGCVSYSRFNPTVVRFICCK